MAYSINRTLSWIGEALDRARGQTSDGSDPRVVPDVIMPTLDAFGWDRWRDRVLSAVNTAPVGDVSVFPAGGTPEWPGAVGVDGVTRLGVVRVMYNVHVEHDDNTNRQIWIAHRKADTGAEIKIPCDSVIVQPKFYPVAAARMFLLLPGEFPIGRTQSIGAGNALTLRYSWFDVSPGEYAPSLL